MRVVRIYHAGRDAAHRGRDRALAAAGAEVTLVLPTWWPKSDGAIEDEPFEIVELPVERPGDVNRHRYAEPSRIAALVDRLAPDVVDLHEEPFSAVVHQLLAAISPITPVVSYTAQNLDKRYPPPFTRWERAAFGRLCGIYPCSRQAASVVVGRGYRGQIDVLPLGINPDVFRLGDQRHDAAEFRLALVGRMVAEKGVRDAVRVLAEVRRHRPATLVLAGAGPELANVDAYAAQLGVTGSVQIQPWAGEAAIAELYQSTHVVLVPSRSTTRWVEQFGRIVVEAQASGAVVAGYASGTIPEVAAGGAALSAEGDDLGLARAVTRIASDPDLWCRLRDRGSAAAADKTWTQVAAGQLDFYAAAVATGPRPPVLASLATRRAARTMYGAPAVAGDGQIRPFALPVFRDSAAVGRAGGAVIDLAQRRWRSTRS